MKDLKILHYNTCIADLEKEAVVFKKWGANSIFQENKALEALLLPYLNSGYKIIHVVHDGHLRGFHIFLEKD